LPNGKNNSPKIIAKKGGVGPSISIGALKIDMKK
jgi:hypothetical protein